MLALSALSTAEITPGPVMLNLIKSFARGNTTPFSSTTVAFTNATLSQPLANFLVSVVKMIFAALPAVRSSSVVIRLPLLLATARNAPGSNATFQTRGDASLLIDFVPSDLPFKKSSTSSQLE